MAVKFSRTLNINGFFVDLFIDEKEEKEFIIFHGEKWYFDDKALLRDWTLGGKPVEGAWGHPFYLIDKRNNSEWRLHISLTEWKSDGLLWMTGIHYEDLDEPFCPCYSDTRRYADQEEYDPSSRFIWTEDDFKEPIKNPNTSSRNHPLFTDPTQ